jgi:hypothetical protein
MIKREGWSEFLYVRERVIGVRRWMKIEKGGGGGGGGGGREIL